MQFLLQKLRFCTPKHLRNETGELWHENIMGYLKEKKG